LLETTVSKGGWRFHCKPNDAGTCLAGAKLAFCQETNPIIGLRGNGVPAGKQRLRKIDATAIKKYKKDAQKYKNENLR